MNDKRTNNEVSEVALYMQFLADTDRDPFEKLVRNFEINNRIENASIHFEELSYEQGRVDAQFAGPIQLRVTTDEHADEDVFDFSVKSRGTGHLREAAFTLSRAQLDAFINDLIHLKEDLDRRRREQLDESIALRPEFEAWKRKRNANDAEK